MQFQSIESRFARCDWARTTVAIALAVSCMVIGGSCSKSVATNAPTDVIPREQPQATPSLATLLHEVYGKSETESPSLVFSDLKPGEEFRRVSEALKSSNNFFHGRAPAANLRKFLDKGNLSQEELFSIYSLLPIELLKLGMPEDSLAVTAQGLQWLEQHTELREAALPTLLKNQGVAHLRIAENQNCISRHCAQSCIYPVTRGGVHTRREAAENARRSFEELLKLNPTDLDAMWVLNIVNMTLGTHPEGVPAEFRIAPKPQAASTGLGRFVDIAPELGVNRLNLAGGVVVEDFNADGRLDILTSTADPDGSLKFYHSDGQGRFVDMTEKAGLADQFGGLQCTTVDYNNDGLMDVFVPRGAWFLANGRIRKSLLRNNGDGTFTDVTREAGLAEPAYPTQAFAWGDYDQDGDLDVYIGSESLVDRGHPKLNFPSQFFRNNGDGTFTDIAQEAGVTNDRYAKGVSAGDYDNDGDLDIYVCNYHEDHLPSFPSNRLYRNNGDGTLTDVAEQLNVTHPERSFATWFFDYDNDGWLDLFAAAYGSQLTDIAADHLGRPHRGMSAKLYRNEGKAGFRDVTAEMGLDFPSQTMGSSFGDLDNDGFLDIYLGTGGPHYDWLVPNIMLRNNAGKRFEDVTTETGTGHLQKGHGIVFADLDNDGDQDIYAMLGAFFPGDKFTNAMFLNPGHRRHFLKIKLVGTRTNRQGVGARITVHVQTPSGPRQFHRAAGMVASFGGLPTRQEIGLGDATAIESVEVWWPTSNTRQTFKDVPLDSYVQLTEAEPEFVKLELPRIDFEQHVPLEEKPHISAIE